MKKNVKISFNIMMLSFAIFSYGQGVGINTNNPINGTQLHIDGQKDNQTNDPATIPAVNSVNDFVVTNSGQVGVKNVAPDASSSLDVQATDKGFTLPHIADEAARNLIKLPEPGLVIYFDALDCIQVNVGTKTNPSWQCVNSSPSNQQMVATLPSYSKNDTSTTFGSGSPRGSLSFALSRGGINTNLIIGQSGSQAEGDLTLKTTGSTILNHVLVHGWQNATSNNKEGGGTFLYIANSGTYYRNDKNSNNNISGMGLGSSATLYRGGASGGEFINYTIIDPTTQYAFRVFLTLLSNNSNQYQPGSGAGRYLIVAERFN